MAESNYGSSFLFGAVTFECIVIDYPEISTKKISATNHGSGGKTIYIPGKLVDASDMTVSAIVSAGKLIALNSAMVARTVDECVLSDEIDTFTFDGFIQSIKKDGADANNEDLQKVTIVFVPTGGIAITATA